MVRNLFQSGSLRFRTSEHNSGGKVIQISEHRLKAENKKTKLFSARMGQDSLARNLKQPQNTRFTTRSVVKTSEKPLKKPNIKFFILTGLFYAFAIGGIVFGLIVLLGGVPALFK
ncbi:hypothetical protein [Spirobacillus cienkowskii]|jgi:hypothetical protein|uniref:Uncharacterized protein n=1 Tax=Spirobacillus cienkowskii TaxID=495820 RepID=A0A369KNS0_9BACT|nr:MAG: hypothetical protein DCC88_05400 [Spirobacillus cienkowskii]